MKFIYKHPRVNQKRPVVLHVFREDRNDSICEAVSHNIMTWNHSFDEYNVINFIPNGIPKRACKACLWRLDNPETEFFKWKSMYSAGGYLPADK